mgnify:CR=1 FL=1
MVSGLTPAAVNSSVATVGFGSLPPKAIPAVLVPPPAKSYLDVFKSAISVQLDPFQDSTIAVLGPLKPICPPKTIAAVLFGCDPVIPKSRLFVFKSPRYSRNVRNRTIRRTVPCFS